MTVIGYILDGLEAELALERELGIRAIEFDRTLLTPPPTSHTPQPPQPPKPSQPSHPPQPSQPSQPPQPPQSSQSSQPYDFVFLHDRPLSGAGAEMMGKITAAMKRTPETAPVIFEPPRPNARIYVVLGDKALKKWFPGINAGPGMWVTGRNGEEVLVTYSPNFFLRFGTVTPVVQKIKKDMWTSLKGILQRLELLRK